MSDEFIVFWKEEFDAHAAPRAMNMATAQAHAAEWDTLAISELIVTTRAELIMEQAVDQMYLWVDREMATVWMDCPDLACEHAILLGATPTLAHIKEAAREHVREAHAGGPIVLRIDPDDEGPVHSAERGGTVVDDPAP